MREPSPIGRLRVVRLTEIPIEIRWAAANRLDDDAVRFAALAPSGNGYRVSAAAYERVLGPQARGR